MRSSFFRPSCFSPTFFVGLANYIKMFTPGRRNDFPGAVLNSLTYAALSMYVEMFSNHKYSYASAQAMFIVFECLVFTMLLNALFSERDDRELKRGRRRLAA